MRKVAKKRTIIGSAKVCASLHRLEAFKKQSKGSNRKPCQVMMPEYRRNRPINLRSLKGGNSLRRLGAKMVPNSETKLPAAKKERSDPARTLFLKTSPVPVKQLCGCFLIKKAMMSQFTTYVVNVGTHTLIIRALHI